MHHATDLLIILPWRSKLSVWRRQRSLKRNFHPAQQIATNAAVTQRTQSPLASLLAFRSLRWLSSLHSLRTSRALRWMKTTHNRQAGRVDQRPDGDDDWRNDDYGADKLWWWDRPYLIIALLQFFNRMCQRRNFETQYLQADYARLQQLAARISWVMLNGSGHCKVVVGSTTIMLSISSLHLQVTLPLQLSRVGQL